jgi:hypothetical protein
MSPVFCVGLVGLLMAGLSVTPVPAAAGHERPFATTSAWNTPIPARPVLDNRSPLMVAHLSGGLHPAIANLYDYGVPIWEADAATPTHAVRCLRPWGSCELQRQPVPVPDGAYPSRGSDAAMVVVDAGSSRSFEFFEAGSTGAGWTAGWGGVVDTRGQGTPGAAVGAGVSRLAGVVRVAEVERGVIDHALVFSTNNACRWNPRYPASKSDGASVRPDCIPEGARIQLDPAVDVDGLAGLTAGERMVAKALQDYGAYAVDNGGARMAFIFEMPSGEADPYPSIGFTHDYFAMDGIPWQRLRVLRSWHGGAGASLIERW